MIRISSLRMKSVTCAGAVNRERAERERERGGHFGPINGQDSLALLLSALSPPEIPLHFEEGSEHGSGRAIAA